MWDILIVKLDKAQATLRGRSYSNPTTEGVEYLSMKNIDWRANSILPYITLSNPGMAYCVK